MSIKLDWEIEAERQQVRNTGEDPEMARKRRLARLRLLIFVIVVLSLLGGVAGAAVLRLREVDRQIAQLLTDTVDAEIAALRIGDRSAFLGAQRSATQDWLNTQEALFDSYQALKTEADVRLTGRVLDMKVEGQRGRVQVEEIVDGVPYARVWFYWRYEDGWRHVPPDYTFWGEAATYTANRLSVRYRAMDAPFAQALGAQLEAWLGAGCAALSCGSLPEIDVEIIPDEALQAGWSASNPWLLQLPSPYTGRARMDMPFDPALQAQVAGLLAERMTAAAANNMQPVYPSDAVFLAQTAAAWLADRFTGAQSDSYLIASLAQNYGENAVGRLLEVLQSASDISVLNPVTGAGTLNQANLDWRDFMTWRLNVEQELIARRDEANFLALYDTGDDSARNIAAGRFNAELPAEPQVAVAVVPEVDANGVAHLRGRVQIGSGDSVREEEVIFRLVAGVWKRVN